MGLLKKRKILQIFSNGSLNFYYGSFFSPKGIQMSFYEKDFKNLYIYNKNKQYRLKLQDVENVFYRKKYVYSKNQQ